MERRDRERRNLFEVNLLKLPTGTEGSHVNFQQGKLVFGPRREPGTSEATSNNAQQPKEKFHFIFHSSTVHLDTIRVFYLPTDAQESCFKRILKFTLKQLLHVSVQSPSSGSVLFELAKVIVIKIIS